MDRLRASAKTLALIAVAILVAAGTYAIAAIPDSGGVITACWDHNNDTSHFGTLRVIDPSLPAASHSNYEYSCLTGETQITWNQQGPNGAARPSGPAGAAGPQGPQGVRSPESVLSFTGGVRNGIFLSIGDIKGGSTVKGHKDEIELQSISLGGTGGAPSGKVKHAEIIVVKRIDKSSPALFKAAATGKHFQTAVITLRKAGGTQSANYLKFTMSTVIISSVTSAGHGSATPTEAITLNFT